MDLGVQFDAEYDGADRFVENSAQSAHFGPLWALNGHLRHFGQINVYEIILFLHKKVHIMPLIYHSTNFNHTLIKGPVTWPQRGQGPLAIFVVVKAEAYIV